MDDALSGSGGLDSGRDYSGACSFWSLSYRSEVWSGRPVRPAGCALVAKLGSLASCDGLPPVAQLGSLGPQPVTTVDLIDEGESGPCRSRPGQQRRPSVVAEKSLDTVWEEVDSRRIREISRERQSKWFRR